MEVSSKPPIKQLASSSAATRGKNLKNLLTLWLPYQTEVSDDEMKRVWKALFYCLWHADKAPDQSAVIHRLTSVVVDLKDLSIAAKYFSVFLVTMRREWSGIDHLRLDKFYLLIRRFIHSVFMLLEKNAWDLQLLGIWMGILEEKSLLANDKLLGNGVNYHIASIFLDELKAFLPLKLEKLEGLFRPLFSVMGKCQDKLLVSKAKSNVLDVLLRAGKSLLDKKKLNEDFDDNEMMVLGTIALKFGFSLRFYDMGSSQDCMQANRKAVLGVYEEFARLEKELESSGIQIEIPDSKVGEDEEVPLLIPLITVGENMDASENAVETDKIVTEEMNGSRSSKKGKKRKMVSGGRNKKSTAIKNGSADGCSLVEEKNLVVDGEAHSSNGNVICLDGSMMSNLQIQFEKVASEDGLDKDGVSILDSPLVTAKPTNSKRKKRARNLNGEVPCSDERNGEGETASKSGEKSRKKVKFAMKNNLVWKPHTPLPPESLRIPPSVTPRGSALKKGLPPGPIREVRPATKKGKMKKKKKRGMKGASIKGLQILRTVAL